MRFKRLLALLLAAALALAVLVGCGSGQQSVASALLKLLDGKYPNISVELDPDLEADLRQAVNEGETDAEIRAALEKLLGSGVSFRLIGDGQKGDSAWNLILYPGSDPDAAARSAYLEWDKIFSAFPSSGLYTAKLSMIETENGYAILVKATVDKAASRDDDDDDEPEEPEDPGYTDDGKTYTVTSADGLMAWNKAVQKDLSLNCTLTEDITIDSDWEPIGLGQDGFTGTFDGVNHTITMEGTGTQVLFQYIAKSEGSTGTVKDLTIQVDSPITVPDDSHFGAVAIINYGTIQNCHVTGGGTIQGSTAADYVGGIVGVNNGAIQGCSATVAVKNGSSTGGIVGINRGTVTACYSTGDVSGNEYTGGVVGWNESGTVTACYHAGTVQGSSSSTGGVVGDNYGTVTACYWSGIVKDEDGKETNAGIGAGYQDGDPAYSEDEHQNKVTDDWSNAYKAMNTALGGTSCPWRYSSTGTLIKQ